ncbi:hypothetical protein Unana1_03240 [Umbelopsis nana]
MHAQLTEVYACLLPAPGDIPSALPSILLSILPSLVSADDNILADTGSFIYLHLLVSAIFEDLANIHASSARDKGKRKLEEIDEIFDGIIGMKRA